MGQNPDIMSTINYTEAGPVLAEIIRSRRRALGLEQRQLAELASTSRRFIYALEGGKPTVRLDKLLVVLDALGLEVRVGVRGESPS